MFFKYKADRIPITIFTSFFVIELFLFFNLDSKLLVLSWMVLMMWPKVIICSWNHHHQHVKTFRYRILNMLLEIIYAIQTGAMPNMWVLHHNLGHHLNYLDQSKDESRWKNKHGKIMGELRYSLEVMLTSFYRAFLVGKKYPKVQIYYITLTSIVVSILIILLYINWFNALFIFIVPMLFSLFMTANATYNHHSGLESEDPYKSSRNYTDKIYNFLSGNLGYHTAHHVKFGLHWSKLPEFHDKIKDKIPSELIIDPPYRELLNKIKYLFSKKEKCN